MLDTGAVMEYSLINTMVKSEPHTVNKKYVVPLHMNGLRGRMLRAPSSTGRSRNEFLIVYGQKQNIEKWFPLASELMKYGSVTIPDLPGFGGMESFYKLGIKPTIDDYADYLAAFIKLRYRRKRLSIVGLSFGFVIVTRMLQKYPEISKKVNLLFNVSSFSHSDDLKISRFKKFKLKIYTKFFTYNLPATAYRGILLRPHLYNRLSKRMRAIQQKSHNDDKDFKTKYNFDLKLRRKINVKTQMFTLNELLRLDNTKQRVDLPLVSINGTHEDHLRMEKVDEHLRSIYKSVSNVKLKKHPLDLFMSYSQSEIQSMMPAKLKKLLNDSYDDLDLS